mmetsp:Transcript_56824/g.169657  ORF Transcript_56824/g.169657 Transcript_56824/m.169657 type:complete len:262 (-) Transcript_56824:520-1305(-)
MILATASLPSALACSSAVLPSLSVTLCRPSLMQLYPDSETRNFAPSTPPWNPVQWRAFHPSSSVMAGSAPKAFICFIALVVCFTPIAAMIIMGVQPLSSVRKLMFDFFIAAMRDPMSASAPASQVSNRISSKLRVSFFSFLGAFFRTTALPALSTISSSEVSSSLAFSPKIFFSAAFCSPPPMSTALARGFSIRLNGPIIVWIASPTIMPLYQCRPRVIITPNTVLVRRDRACDATWAPNFCSVYFFLALGSSNGWGGGAT